MRLPSHLLHRWPWVPTSGPRQYCTQQANPLRHAARAQYGRRADKTGHQLRKVGFAEADNKVFTLPTLSRGHTLPPRYRTLSVSASEFPCVAFFRTLSPHGGGVGCRLEFLLRQTLLPQPAQYLRLSVRPGKLPCTANHCVHGCSVCVNRFKLFCRVWLSVAALLAAFCFQLCRYLPNVCVGT